MRVYSIQQDSVLRGRDDRESGAARMRTKACATIPLLRIVALGSHPALERS